jgi:cytochrome c oxidase subunit 1
VIDCVRNGKPTSARPWESAKGLEWTLEPKAQYHSFNTPPTRALIEQESQNS